MKNPIIIRHYASLLVAVCLLIGLGTTASADLGYETVETLGTASTRELAIDRALVNAVTQVNGAAIASRTRTSLSSKERIENNRATSVDQSSFSEAIQKKTKGVVKSFEIISEEEEKETQTYRVTLSVTVATFRKSAQLNRIRMAVVPFRINRDQRNRRAIRTFEENFRRSLENYLTQTRRFAILDRSFLREQDREAAFIRGSGMPTEELARLGNRVGTDYLIAGVVEKAYAYVKKTTMRTTGQVIKTPQVGARIAYRVLDVATSQVSFAATAKLHRESGSLESMGDAIAKMAGQKILNAIFPIYVLAVDGENVTLGQGGDTVKKDAVYSLVRLGKELIDPHTEETLGRTEKTVGSIRVTDTQARMSTGQILKLTISKRALLKDDFIVRPRKGESGAEKRARKMKQTEKEIDAEFKKFDDDEEEGDKKW
ncbi:MAG: hypothetical protein VYA17_10275 [Pseudomonadota bacterium]|nr:hypothetical protein [Pseudomonadota bacterium]